MSTTITDIRLTDALVQVGAPFVTLGGFGDDKFTLAPASDVGSAVGGVDGDVMFVGRRQNLWIMTITFLNASSGITTLQALNSLQVAFPFSCTYGDFSLVGFAKMMNLGELTASLGTTTRTMTMNVAKVSGNTDAAPGTILQVL
jgi:hypothetical protein